MTITRTQVDSWKISKLYDLATKIDTENQLFLDQLDRTKKVFSDAQAYWAGMAHDAAYDRVAQDYDQGYKLFLEVRDAPAVLRQVASSLDADRTVLLGKVADATAPQGPALTVDDNWKVSGSDAEQVRTHQGLIDTAYRALEASAKLAVSTVAEHAEYIRAAGDLLGSGLDVSADRTAAASTRLAAEDGAALADALRRGDYTAAAAVMAHQPKGLTAQEIQDIAAGKNVPGVPADVQQYYRDFNKAFYNDPGNTGNYKKWMENAEKRGVSPATIVDIARTHGITPEDFKVLDGMKPVTDDNGKTYFLIPDGTSGNDVKKAVLMTYILNAGTDYDAAGRAAGGVNDFRETPYSSAEIQRIIDRQNKNPWSYNEDVAFVNGNGGRLATTPNGMIMGLGGNWLQDLYSQKGGTTYGDIFMFNIDNVADPADQLRKIVESGTTWFENDKGPYKGNLDLDRLLHHEERHSRQWADKGYFGMIWAAVTDGDGIEKDAGLRDGGYK
ncbi:ESX-1 secretion-associated protein [Nocardia sp. NPDC052566]|uniref:ESX-1 secretion-associated protein n=1 Tax=Nocardia sp. NPDC052566 TaxID=3364330 RepID=UPI0037C86C83